MVSKFEILEFLRICNRPVPQKWIWKAFGTRSVYTTLCRLEKYGLVKREKIGKITYIYLTEGAYRYLGARKSFFEHPATNISKALMKRDFYKIFYG